MKYLAPLILVLFLISSCSKGIKSSRVCALDDNFDPLVGCTENIEEFIGVPQTVIFSFKAKDVSRDSKLKIEWFFEDDGRFQLIDSVTYYTKLDEELIVTGIDRNFLQTGFYVVKLKLLDYEKSYEHEHRFKIVSDGIASAQMLLVGSAVDPNGLVIKPEVYFDENHARIFVSTYVYDAQPNSDISVLFKHKEIEKFSKQYAMNVGANPKSKFLLYAYLPNRDLPLGEYEVIINLDKEIYSAPFFIDGTQSEITE